MSSDFPRTPREELEARLTALLLGELSADEASTVRRALAQDAELTKLHDRLQATIGLVRETVATQAGPSAEQPALRLSDERREKLLAHFKTAPLLPKLASDQKAKRSWLIPMSVAAALVVLAGIAVLSGLGGRNFGYLKSRTVSLSESPTLLTEGLSASSEPLDQVVTDSAIQGVSNVPPTRTVTRDGQPAGLYSVNVVGYHKVTPPMTDGATTLSLPTGGKPVSPPPLVTAIAESEPHVTTTVPDAAARVAATTPADPASARRPSSSIVLPSLSQSTNGAKLAETKYAVGDQDWAVALERPAPEHSQENRFLGRYAYEAKPTSDAAVAAAKPVSWYFDKAGVSQGDFYGRVEGRSTTLWDDNSATRGFYSVSDSQGLFAKEAGANRAPTGQNQELAARGRGALNIGQTVTGLPAHTANGVVASGGVDHDGFYGGYAVKPPPASVKLQGFTELNTERQALAQADADANGDKTLALGDTPELGQRFYRITGGVGGGAAGAQAQPPPSPASPALQADAGAVVSAATKSKGVELVPFQPQMPAPTLKGTPEDLPRDPNLEPLGAKPEGTVVLGQPEAAQAAPESELQAAFRRRYGLASAGEPLAGGVAKASAVEGTTLNFGVAAVKSPASVEAKEAPTAVGRGLTPLASARRGDEPTLNAGDLVLSRRAAESDRKQVVEVRERYLADSGGIPAGGRIAPEEKVQSMDVDALTVTTAAGKDVVGVALDEAARGKRSSIVLPATETAASLGFEVAKTEELARTKIAPARPSSGAARSESARLVQDNKLTAELANLGDEIAKTQAEVKPIRKSIEISDGDAALSDGEAVSSADQLKYDQAKQRLDDATRFRSVLNMKLASQAIDTDIPRTTMVEVVDRAEPPQKKSGTFGGLLAGSYAGTARIRVDRDVSDIRDMLDPTPSSSYDPYIAQTECEVMRSELILSNVVKELNLQERWSKESGGGKPLKEQEALAMLRSKLDLKPVKGTSLLEIRAKSDDPQEAAKIANAVAETYRDYRLDQHRQLTLGGIRALEERDDEQERKVREVQKEVDELRAKFALTDADAVGSGPSPLLEAETLRRLEGLRIESEARYAQEEKLLKDLQATPGADLKKVLPGAISDPHLNELLQQSSLLEQSRMSLKKDLADDHPSVMAVTRQIAETERKINERTQGIMKGLGIRVASLKQHLDSFNASVEKAKGADRETADKNRRYWEAKAKLAELVRARETLAAKTLAGKTSDTEKAGSIATEPDLAVRKPSTNAPIPQPEVQTSDNAFSTFSLNVSDVAFKLAAASLEKGQMPDAASVRAEEFINAFDYRDPEAPPGVPIAFAWERARYPFAHNRDLLRFSLKTAAAGRQAGRPLNLVLLLDNSGSMERSDRVQIIREALRVLAGQLQPQDKLSVITFARTPRLWVDGVAGDKSGEVLDQVSGLTPQGGTNLEEAMNLAYATALRHYLAGGINRVVLLTDGAANLGNVESEPLKQKVEAFRQQGVALDCFGIGWEGFNDDLLEVLSRNGDGRYGFINSPDEAATEFAGQLAGALKVAASDVKVQVEFNPKRVTAYRQVGYAKHQLTKEQFRDNTVDAAESAAQEAGNALYTVEVNPAGEGPLCTVRCRFKIPGTTDYREHEWSVPYTGNAVSLEQASPALRLAATASAFAEWLVVSPFAAEVTPDALLGHLSGVPEVYGADARPKKLEWMIRQAKSIGGK